MAEPRPSMRLQFEYAPVEGWLNLRYTPLTPQGTEHTEWSGGVQSAVADIAPGLHHQLDLLITMLRAHLPERPIAFPDGSLRVLGRPNVVRISVPESSPRTVHVYSG